MPDWIKLHRKSLDSRVFSDPVLWRLWCWCLIKSNWKRGWHCGCELQPGQFAIGREAASEELGVSGSGWYRSMQKLQEFGCIKMEANNRFTIVSIVNWRKYQGELNNEKTTDEQQSDNGKTTEEQQKDTIEEGEEVLEGKEAKEGKKKTLADKSAEIPSELLDWIAFWNSLKSRGLVCAGVSSNPGKGILKAWARVQKSPELQELLADKAAIESAILISPFAQSGNWFCFEKLLGGSNGDGCYIVRRLLDGAYKGSGKNSVNLGSGVNFTESAVPATGTTVRF